MQTPDHHPAESFRLKPVPSLPYLSVVGFSGSGKTTLLERLVGEMTRRGLRVGTIKHDIHGFEMDRPGKDSWRHKRAGAAVTMISSPDQIGIVRDVERDHGLEELVEMLSEVDLVLAEGFKRGVHPKIEIHRPEANPEPACKGDPHLIAVASDAPLQWGVPRFSPGDICALTDFIQQFFHLPAAQQTSCAAS